MTRNDVPLLVLAAGSSHRMGQRDKLLEPVDGIPLLRAQVLKALAVTSEVFVALPPGADQRRAAINGLSVTTLEIADHAEGMGATMRRAVAMLPECPQFCLLLGDLPELTALDIRAVLQAPKKRPGALIWRGATQDGAMGHPILFDASLRAKFANLKGDDGGRGLVSSVKGQVAAIPLHGQRARLDLDTPEDWDAWRMNTGR